MSYERFFHLCSPAALLLAALTQSFGGGLPVMDGRQLVESQSPEQQLRPISVSTYAGTGVEGSQDGFRTQATLRFAGPIARGPDGRIYFAQAHIPSWDTVGIGQSIRVIDSEGMVTTYAGSDEPGLVDGPRLSARFRGPNAIVFDHSGNMFVTDRINHRIRKIDRAGNVSTFAGSSAGYRDGIGSNAQFYWPIGMCIDQQDNLYVADFQNIVIRKVTPQGVVTTFAGAPGARGSQDGFRTNARFDAPGWVAISSQGELFVADWGSGLVRKIDGQGMVSTFASGWNYIEVVSVDPQGAVYVSVPPSPGAHQFAKLDASGNAIWFLDNPVGFQDGPVSVAQFQHYSQPLFLPDGNILMAEGTRMRLISMAPGSGPDAIPDAWRQQYFGPNFRTDARAVATADPDGDGANNYQEFLAGTNPVQSQSVQTIPLSVTTFAGSKPGGSDGFRTDATFLSPSSVTFDPSGRLWITEAALSGFGQSAVGAHRVRVMDLDQVVRTVAGSSEPGLVDGPAATARFSGPHKVAFDHQGNAFVAEESNHRIRKIDPAGVVSTFAGSQAGFRDGVGTDAMFDLPICVISDSSDNLYVADFGNLRIRKISPDGVVTTYAGGQRGSQDGPVATASFNSPGGLAFGPDGSLFVSDWANGSIRRIKDGQVTTFAQGPGYIDGVNCDLQGNLYAAFNGVHYLLKYSADGKLSWTIPTGQGFEDGPIASAKFSEAAGAPLPLPDGNLLVYDVFNNRIRHIQVGVPPLLSIIPEIDSFTNSVSVTLSNRVRGGVIYYTLQGSEPQPRSLLYTAPILIQNTTTIKARIFVNGVPVSDVVTRTFVNSASPSCVTAPPGLVGWWPGEGTAADLVSGNSGVLRGGAGFQPGKVGQAFRFDKPDAYLAVPAAPALDVGKAGGLTIESWINPSDIAAQHPILEWNSGTAYGAHFYVSVLPPNGAGPGCLYANLIDTFGGIHTITSAPGLVKTGEFQHVAITYDRLSGAAVLYLNGVQVIEQHLGSFVPQTSYDLLLGYRPPGFDGSPFVFAGAIDEVGLYNRALTAREIGAIYAAGSAGKCGVLPFPVATYSLGTDWSDTANPNGVWAFRAGTAILPRVSNWELDNFNPPQGGWAFGSTVPFWFRASSPPPSADEDWQLDDIVVHTHAPGTPSGGDNGLANVTWTSPGPSNISISGGVWEGRDIASADGGLRGNRWNLYLREALVSTGVIGGADPFSRATPFTFDQGSGGAAALKDLHVVAGDVVRLEFVPTSYEGDYVGVQLTITADSAARPGIVSTLAGSGNPSFQDATGLSASFNAPNGGYVGPDQASYIADTENHRIRRVDLATGQVTTVAGSGVQGNADGPAQVAQFSQPLGLFVDRFGTVLVADTGNHRIRKISSDNPRMVSTYAGGARGYLDGPAATAQFDFPNDLVMDSKGNIFITEFNDHTIRKLSAFEVTTFVGNGRPGFEDGPRTKAGLSQPAGLAIDKSDNLYVTEWGSHRIRKVTPAGVVTTQAGSIFPGFHDGMGAEARFLQPDGIAIDPAGVLFVTEHGNHTVRRITPDGTVSTVAGLGSAGWVDGLATIARFNVPGGLGLDAAGNLIIADTGNHRIRRISFGTLTVVTPIAFDRSLPSYYAPEVRMTVRLESVSNPSTAAYAYAVEDFPPTNWVVGKVSEGGVYDAANQKVKFGPFLDVAHRVLTYEVTPPPGEVGPKTFNGVISADGFERPVGGIVNVVPAPFHPADLNPADQRININEVTAYAAAWRKGSPWLQGPNPIPIDYVSRAGLLWKNGELYTFDPNAIGPPLWWVNNPGLRPMALQQLPLAASSAIRVLPRALGMGDSFQASLIVQPSASVSAYAVEERIPAALAIVTLDENGEYDANGHVIRWGPFFDSAPRELTCQATVAAGSASTLEFSGVVSFDGASEPISGQQFIGVAVRLGALKRLSNGDLGLPLDNADGKFYRIQTSVDLRSWTELAVVQNLDGMLRFADPSALRFPSKFYRLASPPQ